MSNHCTHLGVDGGSWGAPNDGGSARGVPSRGVVADCVSLGDSVGVPGPVGGVPGPVGGVPGQSPSRGETAGVPPVGVPPGGVVTVSTRALPGGGVRALLGGVVTAFARFALKGRGIGAETFEGEEAAVAL